MARRSSRSNPDQLRKKLIQLLEHFEEHLKHSELRVQVRELIPANHLLRDLGSSLISEEAANAAIDRILLYFKKYVGQVIDGEELMVVAGISDYARRIRELRIENGWKIVTGYTIGDMKEDEVESLNGIDAFIQMKPDDYVLLTTEQDRDAAHRWHLANRIRKDKTLSVQNKILKYLRSSVGKQITGEELRYVANNKTEWARRTRELRTEEGWPIVTKNTGDPSLSIGTYVLIEDKQVEPHDRHIPDDVRFKVLERDHYRCRECKWDKNQWHPDDPRDHLELHHIQHHANSGKNTPDNLITYCNVCHDVAHRESEFKKL